MQSLRGSRVLRELFGRSAQSRLSLLRALWPRIVGTDLASRTALLELRGDTLCVRVGDARWMKVLHGMRRTILSRLAEAAGGLAPRRLGFLEGHPPPPLEASPEVPAVDQPDPPSPALRGAAAAIPDAELRELFVQTARRYLGRRQVDYGPAAD
jgi:hypothetical protein